MATNFSSPEIGDPGPIRVFFSYAHKDGPLRDKLHDALIGAESRQIIRMWWDRQIPPGEKFGPEIDRNISAADIVLALLSIPFTASKYCQFETMAARNRKDALVLFPVYLNDCDLEGNGWDKTQVVPQQPIQAWRRRDAAWTEVATRIREKAEDLREKRRHAAPPTAWSVPDRDPLFFGREELLYNLLTAFADRATGPWAQALVGGSAIGKTSAAAEFAHRHRADYDVGWWMQAATPITLRQQFAELGHNLGLHAADTESQIRLLQDWLAQNSRWLLVFDDVRSPEAIYPLLPPPPLQGHVLFTSKLERWEPGVQAVPMGGVSEEDAMVFLLEHAGLGIEEARRLAEACQRVPHALAAAVTRLRRGDSVADVLSSLASRRGGDGQ